MHTITILRDYMGISQTEMAKRAKLTQPDISEMEHRQPYGQITKYQRLAAELGTTVHSLVMNSMTFIYIRLIGASFSIHINRILLDTSYHIFCSRNKVF